jgi:CheY-like chemotaxis protein
MRAISVPPPECFGCNFSESRCLCRARISIEIKGEWHEIAPHAPSSTLFAVQTIAIYEEDDLMRTLLEEWLAEAGYRVLAAASSEVECPRTVDLVIASVYMPKHTGALLVRKIQAAHPGTPLIALSGQFRSGLSSAGAAADALGVQQVIAKPLTRETLLEAVRAMIGPRA